MLLHPLSIRALRTLMWISTCILIALQAPVALAKMMTSESVAMAAWPPIDTTEYYVGVLWWGEGGSEPGQFNGPRGMGSDGDGNIYVSDEGNHRVQKFDSLGSFLMMFGEEGGGPGQFQRPWDVAVDENGFIYVCDYLAHTVQKFDSLGDFVLGWGDPGLEPGQLYGPRRIAIGDSGYIYVADEGDRIQRFTADGEYDMYWTHPNPAVHGGDVVATYPGSVYTYWQTGPNYYFRHDPVGNVIVSFPPGPCPEHYPRELATDGKGALYVAIWHSNGPVSKYDSLGNFVVYWSTGELVDGITVDVAGAVYVAHYLEDVISKWEQRIVGVGDNPPESPDHMSEPRLAQSHPNPFRLRTTITYSLEAPALTNLAIYDIGGALVRTLVSGEVSRGVHQVVWDGTDSRGNRVASGVYFYCLSADGFTETKRMVLLR